MKTYQAYDPTSSPVPLTRNCVQITFPTTSTHLQESIDGFSLFPNPATDQCNLLFRYNGNESPNCSLQLLDLSGRILIEQRVALQPGPNSLQLDTESLSSGVYLVRLVGSGISSEKRLVKVGR